MKKLTWLAILTISFIVAISSCSKTETYADKLKNEKKVLKRFMSENNIQLIYDYPTNRSFKENEFFVDPKTGTYFNVVDSGNGERFKTNDLVYMRYRGGRILPDTIKDTNDGNGVGLQPITFTYGVTTTYVNSQDYDHGKFMSPAVAAPLAYVGEGAIVKIIIPFNLGSSYQKSAFLPAYIDYVKYRR